MMSRRSPRNSAVMASPRRNACTRRAWEAAWRLRAQRLRIGLAEQRLRGLGLASVGPCAGTAEEQPQGGESKRERAAGGEPRHAVSSFALKSPDAGGLAFSSPLRGQS